MIQIIITSSPYIRFSNALIIKYLGRNFGLALETAHPLRPYFIYP